MGNSLVDEENFRAASFMRSKLPFTKLDAVEGFFLQTWLPSRLQIVLLPFVPVTRAGM